MSKKFARQLAVFQAHAENMRRLGYQHVSVKWDGNEFHVEGTFAASEHVGSSVTPPGGAEDTWDRLGRP